MAELFHLDAPELPRAPVLICAVDSWIDAGLAAARARTALTDACDVSVVGHFDAEVLVDHQARRPVMHLVDGVNTGIDWPEIVLQLGADPDGRRFLLLTGAEPDRSWRALARLIVSLARQAGVRQVLTVGAYPAPVPHTRPAKVVATATSQEQANRVGFVPGRLDVPAGFAAAVERACADDGLAACGLWAQVPHYVVPGRRGRTRLGRADGCRLGCRRQRSRERGTTATRANRSARVGEPRTSRDGPPTRAHV